MKNYNWQFNQKGLIVLEVASSDSFTLSKRNFSRGIFMFFQNFGKKVVFFTTQWLLKKMSININFMAKGRNFLAVFSMILRLLLIPLLSVVHKLGGVYGLGF